MKFNVGFLNATLRLLVPQVAKVEDDIKAAKSGPDKKAAVISAVLDGLSAVPELGGPDLLHHPKTVKAIGKVNDAVVEFLNDYAKVKAEIEASSPSSDAGASASGSN